MPKLRQKPCPAPHDPLPLFTVRRGSGDRRRSLGSRFFSLLTDSPRFRLKTWDWIDDPARKRQFNDLLFTEVARKYPFVTRALSLGRDASWKRLLIKLLPPLEQPKCLDLACGTADIAFALAQRYPTGTVLGLDLCDAMLTRAGRANRYRNVTFVRGDMSDCPVASESLDIITGGYALRNAPSLDTVLSEVVRTLRPGGTAAFLDFSKPPSRAAQQLQYLLLLSWGGLWGGLLHRNAEVYAYIAKSLQRFPDRDAYHALLEQRGLHLQHVQRLYGGMLEITVARKDASSKFPRTEAGESLQSALRPEA